MSARRAKVLRWLVPLLRQQLAQEPDPEVRQGWVSTWVQTAPARERRALRRALREVG